MGDHATFSNEDTFAKGKGKADPTNEMSMDDDSSSDSEPELVPENDDEDEGQDHGDPISSTNIIQGGRRTRGKVIDYSKVSADDMEDDEDDDEEYESREDKNEDDDDQMRD